jgi:hypothetical protein
VSPWLILILCVLVAPWLIFSDIQISPYIRPDF